MFNRYGTLAVLLAASLAGAMWIAHAGDTPRPAAAQELALPTAPSGLVAASGDGSAVLSWDADADATGYRYRGGPGARWRELVCDGVVLTSVQARGLTNGRTHTLELEARNVYGWGPRATVVVTPSATASPDPAPDARPPAPSGVTARGGDGSIALSWTRQGAVHGEHWLRYAYRLRLVGGEWGAWQANDCSHAAMGGMTLTGLGAGVTYEVQLRSRNAVGWGLPARIAATTAGTDGPAAPSGLAAAAGDGNAWLSWDADAGVTGYRYRGGPGARWRELVCDGVLLTAGLRGRLTNGRVFTLELQARNADGWGPSATVTAVPSAASPPLPDPDARPPAPAGVTARGGDGSIALSWVRPDAIHSEHWLRHAYRLRLAGGEWGAWQANRCSHVAVGGMTLTGLGDGVAYEVQLRSRNAVGWGPSAKIAATTAGTAGPAAPSGIAVAAGDGNAWLSWDADAGVTGYRYRTGTGSLWRERVCDGVLLTAGLRTGRLTNGRVFALELQARNADGWGSSAAVTAAPSASSPPLPAPDARPPAPSGVTATGGDGSIALSWTRPDAIHSEHWLRYAYRLRADGGEWGAWQGNTCSHEAVGGMTLTGLGSGVAYEVQLRSRNAVGWSASSVAIPVTTR